MHEAGDADRVGEHFVERTVALLGEVVGVEFRRQQFDQIPGVLRGHQAIERRVIEGDAGVGNGHRRFGGDEVGERALLQQDLQRVVAGFVVQHAGDEAVGQPLAVHHLVEFQADIAVGHERRQNPLREIGHHRIEMHVPAPRTAVAAVVEPLQRAAHRRIEAVGRAAAVDLAQLKADLADLGGQPERDRAVPALGIADGHHVGVRIRGAERPVVVPVEHVRHQVEGVDGDAIGHEIGFRLRRAVHGMGFGTAPAEVVGGDHQIAAAGDQGRENKPAVVEGERARGRPGGVAQDDDPVPMPEVGRGGDVGKRHQARQGRRFSGGVPGIVGDALGDDVVDRAPGGQFAPRQVGDLADGHPRQGAQDPGVDLVDHPGLEVAVEQPVHVGGGRGGLVDDGQRVRTAAAGRELQLAPVALPIRPRGVHRHGVGGGVGKRAGQDVFDQQVLVAVREVGEFPTQRDALAGTRSRVGELQGLGPSVGETDIGGGRVDNRPLGRNRVQQNDRFGRWRRRCRRRGDARVAAPAAGSG